MPMYCSNGHRLARLPAKPSRGATIATGRVKFFSTCRGYGFIQPSDSSPDVFVHISVVQCAGRSHLAGGQKVSFDVVTKAGKSAAGNLKVNLSSVVAPSVADPRAFSPNSGRWSSSRRRRGGRQGSRRPPSPKLYAFFFGLSTNLRIDGAEGLALRASAAHSAAVIAISLLRQ